MERVRRLQVLNDRKFKQAQRGMATTYLAAQTSQADEQKAKWVDPYNEFDKNPGNAGNLKL